MEVVLSQARIQNAKRGKKRTVEPHKWKDNEQKRLRNTGEDYTSTTTRRPVAGKVPPTGARKCKPRCRSQACASLTVAEKQNLFHAYYGLGNAGCPPQRTFLLGLMEKKQTGPIKTSYRYHLPLGGERKEICHAMFLDVFKISSSIVEGLQSHLKDGTVVVQERRGKYHRTSVIATDNLRQRMRTHIFGQAIQPVHYSPKAPLAYYLPPSLNVSRMFAAFKTSNPGVDDTKGYLYYQAFNETGIGLQKPRSDTCRVCDKLHLELLLATGQPNEPIARQNMHQHLLQGDSGYQAMSRDLAEARVNPNFVVKVVDLQQVLFCPTLRHQDIFYLRQFSTYNHCVYDAASDTGNMYVWNETEGKRGVNELGSCLLHHISTSYQPLVPGQSRTLVVWSDRCRGQNNNFMMPTLFIYLIQRRYFTKIEQKFLISGHTYMVCDRLFGLIEMRKKVSDAFVPDDWIDVIRSAQPSRPFPVFKLTQNLIFDLKKLEEVIPRPSTLQVTTCAIIGISASDPSGIITRPDHSPSVWRRHSILAPNQQGRISNRRVLNLNRVPMNLVRCYNGLLPLSDQKKDNLRAMLPYLPPAKKLFYDNVLLI